MANICTLAAYERARRALRGIYELRALALPSTSFDSTRGTKTKDTPVGVSVVSW